MNGCDFSIANCAAGRVWLAIPQATEWQRVGNQIDTAFIFARAEVVNVLCELVIAPDRRGWLHRLGCFLVELPVPEQRCVVVLAQVAGHVGHVGLLARMPGDVAAACPHPRIELSQRDPSGAFPVRFPAQVALSVHVLAEHVPEAVRVVVVVVPDLAQECVREANEERRAERDTLAPPCRLEERVERNLVVEQDRETTELEAAVRRVLDERRHRKLVMPFEVWRPIGELFRGEVLVEEGEVFRDEERRFVACDPSAPKARVVRLEIKRARPGERRLRQRLHHRQVLVVREGLARRGAVHLAGVVATALKAGVRRGNSEVGLRVAVVVEMHLGPEGRVRFDHRGGEADRVGAVLRLQRGIVCHAPRERGHRVGEEAGGDNVGVPLAVAVLRKSAPGRHRVTAERIHGIAVWQGHGRREVTLVVAVREQGVGDPAKALEVATSPPGIERRNQIVHLHERRRPPPDIPVREPLERVEVCVDAGDLVVVRVAEPIGVEHVRVGKDRRRVVRVTDVDHEKFILAASAT